MRPLRRAAVLWLAALLTLPLSGCSPSGAVDSGSPFLFNSSTPYIVWGADGYIVINADQPYFVDKGTGVVRPLILDPLERYYVREYDGAVGDTGLKSLFVVDGGAYILENDFSMPHSGAAAFSVAYVDLESFDKSTVIEVGGKRRHNDFLALEELFSLQGTSAQGYFDDALAGLSGFTLVYKYFVLGNSLYAIEGNKLCRYGLSTGASSVLLEGIGSRLEVSCDGEYIYYVNDSYALWRLSLKSGAANLLVDTPVEGLYVSADSVYYKDLTDNRKLYRYDKNTGSTAMVGDFPVNGMQIAGHYLYYLDADWRLLCMPPEGGEGEMVIDEEVTAFYVDDSSNTVYYQTTELVNDEPTKVFYQMDTSGSKQVLILP